jgi:hypothetical protein
MALDGATAFYSTSASLKHNERLEVAWAAKGKAVETYRRALLYLGPLSMEKLQVFLEAANACFVARASVTAHEPGEPAQAGYDRAKALTEACQLLDRPRHALQEVFSDLRSVLGVMPPGE